MDGYYRPTVMALQTTAHTLSFVIGLLAIEQEEQEKLYQHVISAAPNDEKLVRVRCHFSNVLDVGNAQNRPMGI